MSETLYASFADATMAEKAAGALLDYGVKAEDLTLITRGYGTDYYDIERPAAGVDASGNRVAETGDRTAAGVSRAVGAEGRAAGYEAAAERREATATAEAHHFTIGEPEHQSRSDETELAAKKGISTTTPQDAGIGAAKGAGIGLGVGVAAALASLFIPGVGLVFGGGALAMAIGAAASTTVAGAMAGGVYGYLKDQGVSEPAATSYSRAIEQGGALMAVQAPSGDVDRVSIENVLTKYGANSINTYVAPRF